MYATHLVLLSPAGALSPRWLRAKLNGVVVTTANSSPAPLQCNTLILDRDSGA